MNSVIFRGLILVLTALAAGGANGAAPVEIAQAAPHHALIIRAIGPTNRCIGFDAIADGRVVAPVRFTSFGLITSGAVTEKRDGNSSALIFENLQAEPNCGLTLERSRVEVRLTAGQYPVVRFEIHVKAFDSSVWQKTLGNVPLHFLTLTLPGASQWHQGGELFPFVLPMPNTQRPIPIAALPLPVIGLGNPKAGLYAAWDFLPTRLRDNSERSILTAFCRSLVPPPAVSDLPPLPAPGRRTLPGKIFFPPHGTTIPPPKVLRPYLTDHHAGPFVALVLPPDTKSGAVLKSETRLLFNTNLSLLDAPNRFLFQCWTEDAALRLLLPPVPAQDRLPALPFALCPLNLPETQAPETDEAHVFLHNYFSGKNSLADHARAVAALEQARNLVYRDLIFTVGNSDRRDDLDSAFLWQNFTAAKLDALTALAAHTGDTILLWALHGFLARLSKIIPAKAPEKLRRIAPVVGTDARLIVGERTAFAISRGVNVTLSDYRCDSYQNFAVTVQTATEKSQKSAAPVSPALALTVSFPGADLRDKPVYLLRNRRIKRLLRDASQIIRDTAAPDTLLIFGLRDRDRLQIGDVDAAADDLPPPPSLAPASPITDEATGNYQPDLLPRSKEKQRKLTKEPTNFSIEPKKQAFRKMRLFTHSLRYLSRSVTSG